MADISPKSAKIAVVTAFQSICLQDELEGSHNTPGKKAWVKTSFEGKICVNGAPSKGAIQSRLPKVAR